MDAWEELIWCNYIGLNKIDIYQKFSTTACFVELWTARENILGNLLKYPGHGSEYYLPYIHIHSKVDLKTKTELKTIVDYKSIVELKIIVNCRTIVDIKTIDFKIIVDLKTLIELNTIIDLMTIVDFIVFKTELPDLKI